jgi:hypothetical protein
LGAKLESIEALSCDHDSAVAHTKFGHKIQSSTPSILHSIYQKQFNLAVWQRELSANLQSSVAEFTNTNPAFQTMTTVLAKTAPMTIGKTLGDFAHTDLAEDISGLVAVFCSLFDRRQVGLRLSVLNKAQCPRFHVDNVPCRLITTYLSTATQWLPDELVDRQKLGINSEGKPDQESGLYDSEEHIQSLRPGDVALCKGELWPGNQNGGLVHRSPQVLHGQNRLLFSLDFSDE